MHQPTHTRNERGFTLVELLVVIAILALLTGVVVFAAAGITDRGAHAACEGSSDAMRTASETYTAMEGEQAPNLNALITAELLEVDAEASVSGNVVTVDGGTITYAAGHVTDTCA